jgi:hypothetical protein
MDGDNMFEYIKKSQKGSFTIEATLVVSLTMFVILALIFISMLIFQQIYIQNLCDKVAKSAGETWHIFPEPKDEMSKEEYNEYLSNVFKGVADKDNILKSGLYWNIIDFKKEAKITRLKEYIAYEADKINIFKYKSEDKNKDFDTSIKVEVKSNFVLSKTLYVSIHKKYPNPFKKVINFFGLDGYIHIRAKSKALIIDNDEIIRNTDFVVDTLYEIDRNFAGGKGSSFIEEGKKRIDKYFSQMENFLDTRK